MGLAGPVDFDVVLRVEIADADGSGMGVVVGVGGGAGFVIVDSVALGFAVAISAELAGPVADEEPIIVNAIMPPTTNIMAPAAIATIFPRDSGFFPAVVARGAPVECAGSGMPTLCGPEDAGAGAAPVFHVEPSPFFNPVFDIDNEFSAPPRGTPKASANSLAAITAEAKRCAGSRAVARENQISKEGGKFTPRRRARTVAGSGGPLTTCTAKA